MAKAPATPDESPELDTSEAAPVPAKRDIEAELDAMKARVKNVEAAIYGASAPAE